MKNLSSRYGKSNARSSKIGKRIDFSRGEIKTLAQKLPLREPVRSPGEIFIATCETDGQLWPRTITHAVIYGSYKCCITADTREAYMLLSGNFSLVFSTRYRYGVFS